MKRDLYILDTHALIFWSMRESMSEKFVGILDELVDSGQVLVSSISFWETVFLVKKKRVAISDVDKWKSQLLDNTNLHLIEPIVSEMIDSVQLPDFHSDPFDRLLIAQTQRRNALLVSNDRLLKQYRVRLYWESASRVGAT